MQQVIIEMHKNLMGLRDIRDVERVYESFGLDHSHQLVYSNKASNRLVETLYTRYRVIRRRLEKIKTGWIANTLFASPRVSWDSFVLSNLGVWHYPEVKVIVVVVFIWKLIDERSTLP